MRPQLFVGKHKIIDWFVTQLGENFHRLYGGSYPEYPAYIRYVGAMSMELIENSNALYHDVEHSIMVTLCGQEIIRGKHLSEGRVSPEEWLNFIVSLLCHDIGYVRNLCPGDDGNRQVINMAGDTVEMPPGATDAFLTPYHVERGGMFVRHRFGDHPVIDAEIVAKNIQTTQFPVPSDEDQADADGFPGLVRAADLIGQLGDPDYVRKLPALFHEFCETGSNKTMGYSNPKDLADGYPNFYWNLVNKHIQPALRYLRATREGREWVANLYGHVFAQEHRTMLSEEGAELLEKVSAFTNRAASISEIIQFGLDAVCSYTKWPVGHAYALADDHSGELVSTGLWHIDKNQEFGAFRDVTQASRFGPGIGLPGRVLLEGKATWVMDVAQDANFPRAKLAQFIGIHAGFAFPVHEGNKVVTVLEFFSRAAVPPDASVIELMVHMGKLLGRATSRLRGQEMPVPERAANV